MPESDPDASQERLTELTEKFRPLLTFMKDQTFDVARDGTLHFSLSIVPHINSSGFSRYL
jgi:hypothetical protein